MKTDTPQRIFEYSNLDLNQVDAVLAQNGELFVSLPERHARACIIFIETVRVVKSLNKNRLPFVTRCWELAKGLWMTLRLMIAHPRLFQLSRVIILNSSSQTWEQSADHNFLFRFAGRAASKET
jgi:hypothetical protein